MIESGKIRHTIDTFEYHHHELIIIRFLIIIIIKYKLLYNR